ncbi:non-ribosomal peptide synthetase/MFS transporter [Actinomadura sp. 7K507]|uniref:non-ribosomal peptide synthetase/MFS transporter n=1 Tax=Actinomadura sp. 7K507 TaxID=2530365 RepID=UPI0010475B47|nr:non-ribosomal peptide synthetase/MFS transporter [Actinomadura sp. 7K507]TDC91357.1 amino acid adenylation domain-containing protein [Actinomadura sp. 7K507]
MSDTQGLSPAKRALLEQRLRRRAPAAARPVIERLPDGVPPPLSFAQERLWFMEQFAPGTGAYNVPLAVRLRGQLDEARLRASLDCAAARHESLRMRFPAGPDGSPLVVIADPSPVALERADVSGDVEEARGLVARAAARPFDVARGPLLRALLVRVAGDDHVLLVTAHHLVIDGISAGLLAREIQERYAAGPDAPPAPGPPVRYGDYAAWQRDHLSRGALDRDLEYWRERLDGLEPVELPADRPRGADPAFAGGTHPFRLSPGLAGRLGEIGRAHGATPFMTLLAAYQIVLARHSGRRDPAVGTPVGGRPLPELEGLVGLFVNMVTLRADLTGDPEFTGLLARTRDAALDALAHQGLPFEQLVRDLRPERDAARSPVFQVTFTFHDPDPPPPPYGQPGGLAAEPFPVAQRTTRFDLELHVAARPSGALDGVLVYDRGLFDAATIARMAGHLQTLLGSIAERPGARLSELEMLTGDERAERARWNDTAADLGPPATLHGLLAQRARTRPDEVAVVHPGGELTRAEVEHRVRLLTRELAEAGVEREELVAVVMERGWEQIVAVQAIQRAGGAYLPVGPDLPERRLRHLIERGECRVALTQPRLAGTVSWPPGLDVRQVVPPSGGEPEPAGGLGPSRPDDLAYVLFTSGSTGAPKGVMIEHRNAANTCLEINRRFAVGPDDRVLSLAELGFDLSVFDVFGAPAAGAALVMPEPAAARDPAAWARWVERGRITVWNSVPALMELLVEHAEHEYADHGYAELGSLRLVLLSGDRIPVGLPGRIRAVAPNAEVIGLGGPTETSIWCVQHPIGEVDPGWRSIPYGRPLANHTVHILDEDLSPVPVGVTGEQYVGGAGVARGYWRDPERTAALFVRHPSSGERLYRTGDLGRFGPDGVIEFRGRRDAQIKIRGHRVELGEIEAHLAAHPDVAECAVTAQDGELVAHVVAAPGAEPAAAALRAHLARILPGHMVPGRYRTLPRLPLSRNGKVDRNALAVPPAELAGTSPASPEPSAEPATELERTVAEVWREVLGDPGLGADDDFFQSGGHSLAAIKALTRLRRVLAGGDWSVSVMDLFRNPTVRRFARLLEDPRERGSGLLHELKAPPPGRRTLSYVCVPYAGGQPLAFRDLAGALPDDRAVYAVAVPGSDPSLEGERSGESVEDLARRCAAEILERVDGPLALYGHCAGGAPAVELARLLEAAGREVTAVYLGAIFPFARPRGRIADPVLRLRERVLGDRMYEIRMRALGTDVAGLEDAQVRFMARAMRRDTVLAEEYFTRLLHERVAPLRAPIISLVGAQDGVTDMYQERYREWRFLSGSVALVVLDEAGHYFVRYRAEETAEIVAGTHDALAAGTAGALRREARGPAATWWLEDADDGTRPGGGPGEPAVRAAPEPGPRRFLAVTAAQLAAITGSAITDFALPIWIYLTTGSLARFALFATLAIVPGVLAGPLAGAVVDRLSRRTVMLWSNGAAGAVQLFLGTLVWTGTLRIWHVYPLIACLSVVFVFQRLAYTTAIPQLVPKHFLGHANGVAQMVNGIAQFGAPLAAVWLLSTVGLGGVLVLGVTGFFVAVAVLAFVRFPRRLGQVRRETLWEELVNGFRLVWRHRPIRALLCFFAAFNVLLSPLLMSLSPLVLGFGSVSTAGQVAVVGGAGVAVGGLAIAVWGGPRERRVHGVMVTGLLLAAFAMLTGIRPDPVFVAVCAFFLYFWLAVHNGIYVTLIHLKFPQRFHGRILAVNQMIAWSTLPLGFAVAVPLGARLLEPLMAADGALAPTFGQVIGTGTGRGLGLMYLVLGLLMAVAVTVAMRTRALGRFDRDVPDAPPDDLVGRQALRERAGAAAPRKETV